MAEDFRHTGLWPFSLYPRSAGLMRSRNRNIQTAKVFDPVALAWMAGPKLTDAGWVGLELMPTDFLWKIVDSEPEDVSSLAEKWVGDHRVDIADSFQARQQSYRSEDGLADQAATEALSAYRNGHFLATVRTLMPEAERFGRKLTSHGGQHFTSQKTAIEAMQKNLGEFPVSHFSPIESLTVFPVISEHLFARCFTEHDAQQLGTNPNRHAEVHGLASYGNLCGATKMLCVQDFLLHVLTIVMTPPQENDSTR